MDRRIREAIQEVDAMPDRCPWCGYSGMFHQHAPKKHPEKWRVWKERHELKTHSISYWVGPD